MTNEERCTIHSEQLKNIKEDVVEIKRDVKNAFTKFYEVKKIALINEHDIKWIKRIAITVLGSGGLYGILMWIIKSKIG